MYQFRRNYTDFFDLHEQDASTQSAVHGEFVSNFAQFAQRSMNLDAGSAQVIGETLWTRMSDRRLHYHTAVHVISILQDFDRFANELRFPEFQRIWNLPQFHLAIWFHDAVYVIGVEQGANEAASATFMHAMMDPLCRSDKEKQRVIDAEKDILATARFDDFSLAERYWAIMDLDISNFTWEWRSHRVAADCVAREFESFYTTQQYRHGRSDFLTKMRDRERIFRTASLYEYGEALARENIAKALENLGQEG